MAAFESEYVKKTDDNVTYFSDGMKLFGKNTGFLKTERFVQAYKRGMETAHPADLWRFKDGRPVDLHIEWRIHVALWAAHHAKSLPGDFVECGVNTGTVSTAICDYIDFNATNKSFYLFDTFCGIPDGQMNMAEKKQSHFDYPECYEQAKKNFAPFPRAHLIRGMVPESLDQVSIDRVCYLHIDMNIAYPEVAAIRYFWDKLVTGAIVVLDDYAFRHQEEQYLALNSFAASVQAEILTLPTGQGLMVK